MSGIGAEEMIGLTGQMVGYWSMADALVSGGDCRLDTTQTPFWLEPSAGWSAAPLHRPPCEREYLFGGSDCHPANAPLRGRWISTVSG